MKNKTKQEALQKEIIKSLETLTVKELMEVYKDACEDLTAQMWDDSPWNSFKRSEEDNEEIMRLIELILIDLETLRPYKGLDHD